MKSKGPTIMKANHSPAGERSSRREVRALVPQRWLVIVFTFLGIYGMNLVYHGVVNGAWKGGIAGAFLLALTVYVCGSALAVSMWNHSSRRVTRTRDGSSS